MADAAPADVDQIASKASISVPLITREAKTAIGTLTLVRHIGTYHPAEHELAAEIGRRIGSAIEMAELFATITVRVVDEARAGSEHHELKVAVPQDPV